MKTIKQRLFDIIVIIFLVIIFSLIIYKYYHNSFDFKNYFGGLDKPKDNLGYSRYLNENGENNDIWIRIHNEYPKSVNGKEIIYDFLDDGSLEEADNLLNNIYNIERYEPVLIENLTWEEDPYSEQYWKFIFYSLRPVSNLLYASEKTKEPKYDNKAAVIIGSFVGIGMNKANSWNDKHAVAFRAMALTNAWWKLRERNALSEEESVKILKALKLHGDFLADENNFESEYNHGVNEAAALFVLAVNFPDMPGSEEWFKISNERLNYVFSNLIDADGALIENSPYYHFYALEKYWQIYQYSQMYGISLRDDSKPKINSMIAYSTRILLPNLESPLIGASLRRRFYLDGAYEQMAYENPELLYVLSNGMKGKKPLTKSILFPDTGQAILRSGWSKGDKFKEQTQVIFDVGKYRTLHSHLDALNFNLYSNGITMITDSGLYTYENGNYLDYFKGTYSHNTVVVDGKDQNETGNIAIGEFYEGKDYSYQSAMQELYDGVKHKRAMMLIQQNLVIIIDELESENMHDYEQLFHLAPDAELAVDNLKILSKWNGKNQKLAIEQLLPEGIESETAINDTETPKGICSYEYEKAVPCYFVSYKAKADNMKFVTLIKIGDENLITAKLSDGNLLITDNGMEYLINISNDENGQIQLKIAEKRDWPHPYLAVKNLF